MNQLDFSNDITRKRKKIALLSDPSQPLHVQSYLSSCKTIIFHEVVRSNDDLTMHDSYINYLSLYAMTRVMGAHNLHFIEKLKDFTG